MPVIQNSSVLTHNIPKMTVSEGKKVAKPTLNFFTPKAAVTCL
jgi:hypothetical protein